MTGARLADVRRWTAAEIEADALAARAEFRSRRLGEPLSRYLAEFDAAQPVVVGLVGDVESLLGGGEGMDARLRDLLHTEAGRTAFRYLGAPPISEDDLETLAEARLASSAAEAGHAQRERLLAVMRLIADPRRFPWLAERREPSDAELQAAVLASAALMASQRVQTLRRGDEKSAVGGAVKGLLVGMGWRLAETRPARGIQKLTTDSPAERSFILETV